jgi:hypothetical protein
MNSSTSGVYQIATIDLTPEERQKLETLRREMTQSEDSEKQAKNNWQDFKIQLVVNHVGTGPSTRGGSIVKLSTGSDNLELPLPWGGELAFAIDFGWPLLCRLLCRNSTSPSGWISSQVAKSEKVRSSTHFGDNGDNPGVS